MSDALHARYASGFASPIPTSIPTNHSLNGTGIGLAWVVQARTVSAITGLRFRYGARTGTPPSYVATIEGVDTSGKPNGTDKGGGSPTAKIFTPPASTAWDGLTQQIDFTNSYTPATRDEWVAFTIRHSSGTCDASNFSSFTRSYGGMYDDAVNLQHPVTLSGGVWTQINQSANLSWLTAGERFGVVAESQYTTLTAPTNGHRSGAYFTMPANFGDTYTVKGVAAALRLSGANKSCAIVLLDTANNVLATTTIDSDYAQSPGTARQAMVFFPTPVTLNYGTKYRVAIEVLESSQVGMQGWGFASTGDASEMPLGANIGQALWNGATWTEDAKIIPLVELILDHITVPSGGGAGAIVIGTGGGIIRGLM